MTRRLIHAVIWLAVITVVISVLGVLAPIVIPALLGLVAVAWRKPALAARVTNARVFVGLPSIVRATPLRFAVVAAVLFVPLSATMGQAHYFDADPAAPAPFVTRSLPATATATNVASQPTATRVATAHSATPPRPTSATALPPPAIAPTTGPAAGSAAATPIGDAGQVMRVIDGDTIDVLVNGEAYRVRIIGVDTPETKDPNSPVMCYGVEATAKTQALVDQADGKVILEKDISDTDRYGRKLRYVWLSHPDGQRMLNYELVAGGYAQVSTYPPDVKYVDMFLDAQTEARNAGRGLWGACGEFGVPVTSPTVAPAPVAPQPPVGNCSPAYPGVCIPPPPPDLDCGDITFRRFRVLPPDPHNFDSDGDGIGCETG